MRALQRCVEGVASVGRIVVADRAARLHGDGGDAIDDEIVLDHAIGFGDRGIGRGLVADQFDETDIVGAVFPHARRARFHGVGGHRHRRQGLEIDLDQFGGVIRLRHSLGDDEGDIVADPAHAVFRQDRIARLVLRPIAALEAARHRQVAVAGRLHIGRGEHREHAGRGLGGGGIDRFDLGVRMLRAQHHAIGHAGQLDVVDVAPAAADQPRILEARHALTDCEFTHGSDTCRLSAITGPVTRREGCAPDFSALF